MKNKECYYDGYFYYLPGVEEHNKKVETDFDTYYSAYDPYTKPLLKMLDEMTEEHKEESIYLLKARMYELLCEVCPIHLFEESDYFFEMAAGRDRHTYGGLQSEVGSYFRIKINWLDNFVKNIKEDMEQGYIWARAAYNTDHLCPGWDKLLQMGLPGIVAQAQGMLKTCEDPKKRDFYEAVIRANKALMGLAGRFEAKARILAEEAVKEEVSAHYLKIAEAAKSVQERAPQTFYEALSFMLFYRECVGSIDGIGISCFGHLDRMLYPYYKADMESGRITREEALELLCDLFTYIETRFETHRVDRETSFAIVIGGCDKNGDVVYNELTDLVLSVLVNVRPVNVKVNCRISKAHPEEYLRRIARIQADNLPTIMVHNDDVMIPARVKYGQALEDARLYVSGGCHEVVLQETEVCTRADTYLSPTRVLLDTLRDGDQYKTFDEFFEGYIQDVRMCQDRLANWKNEDEQHWGEWDPLVLYSSSMQDCIENGLDVTEGGTRYNTTMTSMAGTATMIDSLYAIKTYVYDRKELTCSEFTKILDDDFMGYEALRQDILKKLPKHGTNNAELNEFAGRVLKAIAATAGQKNGRGGEYMPSFYPATIIMELGKVTGATPDGRLAGTYMSRGCVPSEFVATDSSLDVIQSLEKIDFTDYADSFIVEMTLPWIEDKERAENIVLSLIRGILHVGASSMQMNLQSREMLIDAQKNPQQYPNLCIRLNGHSAVFVTMTKEVQDEIISRAIR